MRIAVSADLHRSEPDGSDIPEAVIDAFAGADLIALCGDIGVAGTIERFATMAEVVAVRNETSADDGGGLAPDVTKVIRAEGTGLDIGLSFRLGEDLQVVDGVLVAAGGDVRLAVNEHFGAPVDVVLFGSTHAPMVCHADGILFVNPGSPTFADRRTVALVDIVGGVCHVQIVDV
ncbi:MAG: metallophosphoesterase family protein [Acidimicrobiales bacterium]